MEKQFDLVIVGGGTAGMTAAIYGARAGKRVLVLEQLICGGQIVNAAEVENYPGIRSVSGADFASALFEQASAVGAEFDFRQVTGLLFGHYSEPTSPELLARLRRFGREHGIPVAYCDDFGHGARHTLLRVGHRVQLDAGEGTLRYL